MAKIIIQRKSFVGNAMCSFDVYLMNQYVGELKNGGTLHFDANVGSYLLEFKAKPRMYKKTDTSFGVVVNDPNEVVMLNAGFKMSGKFSVEYADGQQHIPTYTMTFSGQGTPATPAMPVAQSAPNPSNPSSAPNTPATSAAAVNSAPQAAQATSVVTPVITSASDDGKRKSLWGQKKSPTKNKKSSKKMGCLVPIIVLVVLVSIGSLFMGGDDVSDDDSSSSGQSEQQKEQVLYSDDNFKISMAGFEDQWEDTDEMTSFALYLDIENKSDKKVMVSVDDGYLNDEGVTIMSAAPVEIASGKKKTGAFVVGYGDTSIKSIDEVKKLEFTVYLFDDDMNEVLNTGNITVNMK